MAKYSIAHVRKRFWEIYGYEVVRLWEYKGNRYHCALYNLYDRGSLILGNVTLKALAEHLISKGEY